MNITYAVWYACDCCGNNLTIQEYDAGHYFCKKCRTGTYTKGDYKLPEKE